MRIALLTVAATVLFAFQGSAADVDATALLMGAGNGTQITAEGWNNRGVPHRYDACHAPDGKIVGRATYNNGKVYEDAGTWSTSGNQVTVDWKNWADDGAFTIVLGLQKGFDMKKDGIKRIANAVFTDGYADWCKDKF